MCTITRYLHREPYVKNPPSTAPRFIKHIEFGWLRNAYYYNAITRANEITVERDDAKLSYIIFIIARV